MASMDSQNNHKDLDVTHNSPSSSSKDFKTPHDHQHNIHDSKKTQEDEVSQDFKKIHLQHDVHASKKMDGNESFMNIKNTNFEKIKEPISSSLLAVREEDMTTPPPPPPPPVPNMAVVEESGRDRLMRHRIEMAGRVRIPDIWGHEDLLKDWIDCTVFDSSLGNNNIMSARAALVQERRSALRIENQC